MSTINPKRKYIDSHWLVFALQGLISLLFGWFVMFTGLTSTSALVVIASVVLLSLGIIELVNALYRHRRHHGIGFAIAIAIIEIVISLALLFTINQNAIWHLTIIAVYTFLRGIFEILIALSSKIDATDRFIWLICGICGAIIGFVILNSGHFHTTTFIKFFGSYMMIFGISQLIYGVHNRNERLEQIAERKALADARRRQKLSLKKSPSKASKKTKK